jgi:hypothetical protein
LVGTPATNSFSSITSRLTWSTIRRATVALLSFVSREGGNCTKSRHDLANLL